MQSSKKIGIKLYEELCSRGTHCLYTKGEKWLSSQCGFVFVLRFYGPVNPMGSCRARSVYLANHTFYWAGLVL